jgi:hypothetical protein
MAAHVAGRIGHLEALVTETLMHLGDIQTNALALHCAAASAESATDPSVPKEAVVQESAGATDALVACLERVRGCVEDLRASELASLERRAADIDDELCALDDAHARGMSPPHGEERDAEGRLPEPVLRLTDADVLAQPDLWPADCTDSVALRALVASNSMHTETVQLRLSRVHQVLRRQAVLLRDEAQARLEAVASKARDFSARWIDWKAKWTELATEPKLRCLTGMSRPLAILTRGGLDDSTACIRPLPSMAPLDRVTELDCREKSYAEGWRAVLKALHPRLNEYKLVYERGRLTKPLRLVSAGGLVHVLYAALVWRPDIVEELVGMGLMDMPLATVSSLDAAASESRGTLQTHELGQRIALVHDAWLRWRRRNLQRSRRHNEQQAIAYIRNALTATDNTGGAAAEQHSDAEKSPSDMRAGEALPPQRPQRGLKRRREHTTGNEPDSLAESVAPSTVAPSAAAAAAPRLVRDPRDNVPEACIERWNTFAESYTRFRTYRDATVLIPELTRNRILFDLGFWGKSYEYLFFETRDENVHAATLEFVLRLGNAFGPLRKCTFVHARTKHFSDPGGWRYITVLAVHLKIR